MSISQTVQSLIQRWETILIAVVGLLVVVSVIQTYIRTRSWVPTIGVILLGAVALWGVSNVDTIEGGVSREVGTTYRGQ